MPWVRISFQNHCGLINFLFFLVNQLCKMTVVRMLPSRAVALRASIRAPTRMAPVESALCAAIQVASVMMAFSVQGTDAFDRINADN